MYTSATLVADVIDHVTPALDIKANTTQPVWVSVKVPTENIIKGMYRGTVTIKEDGKVLAELPLTVTVKNRVLPAPSEWAFHLDLWQNPYSVARYHNVAPFSKEHFDLMRPVMKRYADAGGKVITASITHKPWNAQTEDHFESMPKDPWGNDYVYTIPGEHNKDYDLVCYGADGQPGGTGENADITNYVEEK